MRQRVLYCHRCRNVVEPHAGIKTKESNFLCLVSTRFFPYNSGGSLHKISEEHDFFVHIISTVSLKSIFLVSFFSLPMGSVINKRAVIQFYN